MTTDNRTGHLNLPLPHQDNLLEEDVQRLRDAISGLDVHAGQTDAALETKADSAEVNTALAGKADSAAISTAMATKADAAAVQASLALKADKIAVDANLAEHAEEKAAANKAGHVQLATDAEATAGTVTDKAVSPKQIKSATDAVVSAVTDASRADKAASYTSAGESATATGFKLLSGADIGTLFGKIDNVTLATAGSGNYVGSVGVSISGKTAQITQNKIGPAYCGYCSYCSYCTYCNCTSNCACDGN